MPYCPSCKAEYRDGMSHCTDCEIELVDSLPAADSEIREYAESAAGEELVELASFATSSEAAMLQELLESNRIETMLRGLSDQLFAGAMLSKLTVLVERRKLDAAKEIYEMYCAGEAVEEKPAEQS